MSAEPEAAQPRQAWWRRPSVAVGGALAVALIGVVWIVMPKASEATDAAYVQADSSIIAPKVRGLVAEVLVGHDQQVKKGDALVRIDAEEFDARLAASQAELQNATAEVEAAQAALVALDAEERLAAANVHAALTQIRSFDAQNLRASADSSRYTNLAGAGAVAKRDVEQYRAAAISAQADAERSRAQFDVSRSQEAVTKARRAALQANLSQAQAAVARAQAALDLARQDRDHTLIRAPIDGVVGDRQVEVGDYVQPGTRLMSIVPLDALYITANFKETQTSRMRVGQHASIAVDALAGVELNGRVESFAPGSGSTFSLLPFEPGTGNFTKIVQRIPVRIRFEPGQNALAQLRPGLSSTVRVRLSDG